jgi:hypothetical protein
LESKNFRNDVSIDGYGTYSFDTKIPPALVGTLTLRTSSSIGEVTVPGYSDYLGSSGFVDLYWTGGVRYFVPEGDLTGDVLSIADGFGDDLPVVDTVLAVCASSRALFIADVNQISAAGFACEARATLVYTSLLTTDIVLVQKLETSFQATVWHYLQGGANPFESLMGQLYVSQADTASRKRVQIGILMGVDSD